ncbi:MAG TPA: CPXCG motif-containing cysteine-rich protein [Gemmatimonadales bacterium]|nr:CPXCG motif-containing cysteine-rich protein [Gemmatimonadales bacterium]
MHHAEPGRRAGSVESAALDAPVADEQPDERLDERLDGDVLDDDVLEDETLEDAELLDEEFPLGDGTADTTAMIYCPWCGEPNEIGLDPGGGSAQEYVEDCQVCCRPWRLRIAYGGEGEAEVLAEPLGE